MKSFWKQMRQAANGPNTLGNVNLIGTLQDEGVGVYSGRKTLVEARPNAYGPGFALSESQSGGLNVESVYWLPWQNGEVTMAYRADFESKCNYFMTTALSGCRFTVTPTQVLHVAHSAGFNSAGRSVREEELTGPRNPGTRRLSVSYPATPQDFRYGGNLVGAYSRALVFGYRTPAGWVYKTLHTAPAPGRWERIL
jgi:hypothetical protein